MPLLHIANISFEWELIQKKPLTLSAALENHEIFLQLQFLPFLYAGPEDGVAVTCTPDPSFIKGLQEHGLKTPHLHLLSQKEPFSYQKVEPWGSSPSIEEWAKQRRIHYEMPPWEVVRKVNSKEFSFQISPKLPHATLLRTEDEAKKWINSFEGPKILKSCFGVSGRGHFHIDSRYEVNVDKILLFLKGEWKEGRPVIAEPWVNRHLDFSTQWVISSSQEITYLGETIGQNDAKGRYISNRVGDAKKLFGSYIGFLDEHKKFVKEVLRKMASLGFFGNVGIDAMLYFSLEKKDELLLHPIVEINARKTMGYVALQMQRRHFPNECLSLHYTSSQESKKALLPKTLSRSSQQTVVFSKQLAFEI